MTIRIDAALLIPGRGDPIENGTVVLDGDQITYSGPTSDAPVEAGGVDATVPVVMPGLWDCHIHFGTEIPEELGKSVFRSPALIGARAVDELGCDAHPITRADHRPFDKHIHVQLLRNLGKRLPGVSVVHRRRAGDHAKRTDFRKVADQRLRHPIREVLLPWVA
jgi:hypothetical protein